MYWELGRNLVSAGVTRLTSSWLAKILIDVLPKWGISMGTYVEDPYLVRYQCIWNNP
jgi:hypothetical protein